MNSIISKSSTNPHGGKRLFFRFAVLTLLVLTIISCCFIIQVYADDDSSVEPAEANYTMIDTVAGDTLWALANKYAPEDESVRSYMDRIRKANNLSGSLIREGQILYMPQ